MITRSWRIYAVMVLGCSGQPVCYGALTSSGLTLLESPSARAAALADAVSADPREGASFLRNPAILGRLKNQELSALHEQAFEDQVFSQLCWGRSWDNGRQGGGFSASHYSAGELELFDGTQSRIVHANQDQSFTAGYSYGVQALSMGIAVKYLRSQLADLESAHATAIDIGALLSVRSHLTIAGVIQNMGSDLQYESSRHSLPRLVRMGLSLERLNQRAPVTFVFDTAYHLNEYEVRPALGIEVAPRPFILRAGYQFDGVAQGLTLGAGFQLGRFRLDYALGKVDKFEDRHRIGLTIQFSRSELNHDQ